MSRFTPEDWDHDIEAHIRRAIKDIDRSRWIIVMSDYKAWVSVSVYTQGEPNNDFTRLADDPFFKKEDAQTWFNRLLADPVAAMTAKVL